MGTLGTGTLGSGTLGNPGGGASPSEPDLYPVTIDFRERSTVTFHELGSVVTFRER